MARIVILGAGIGGLSVAMELKPLVRDNDEILVVSETSTYNFNPANLSVAINVYKPQDIKIELDSLLSQHNIGFFQKNAVALFPKEKRIALDGGTSVNYDYLVIATGPRPAYEEIPGFGPEANSLSICQAEDAGEAGQAWELFVRNPGQVVVGAVQGASNIAAAYEYAMLVDADLRRRNIRNQAPITFVSAEPYIGHLGFGGRSNTRSLLEKEFENHGISWITNAKVRRIEKNRMFISEIDITGQETKTHVLPFKHCMMMPAYTGVDAWRGIEGLVNERGFVLVDERQRNAKYPSIYAVGVCVDIPVTERTPVPIDAVKNGYMIESMVSTAAQNIAMELYGKEPTQTADWNPCRGDTDYGLISNGSFDKKWINPVCGLYAFSLLNQFSETEQMQS
jgi:sulfide:quinone oxidoreductase